MFVVYWAGLSSSANLGMILTKYAKKRLKFPYQPFEISGLYKRTLPLFQLNILQKTVVTNSDHWILYISGISQNRPVDVRFEYLLTEATDQPVNVEQSLSRLEKATFIIEQPTFQAVGTAFETNRSRIEERWSKEYRNWPVEMQLFYHFRNASFHGNSFLISNVSTPAIDPYTPPQWNQLIIPDKGVTGSRFAGGFFCHSLVLPLLADVGDMLR